MRVVIAAWYAGRILGVVVIVDHNVFFIIRRSLLGAVLMSPYISSVILSEAILDHGNGI